MKKTYLLSFLCLLLWCSVSNSNAWAQTTIAGTITDQTTGQGLVGASVTVKGKLIGTTTDNRGNFSLKVNQPPPFTVVVSLVGRQTQERSITEANVSGLTIALAEQAILGQEVVIAASRVEETVLQSPVSIEKMDIRTIRETPAVSFYDALNNIKGVEMSTQSLTFKSVNTRGFNANGNYRMVQLIDGMDNQAPGLNFSVGNIVGMPELDVESVELLPGASSALYGPNAINGILLMTSKSPFLYQGLSAQAKVGVNHVNDDATSAAPLYDMSIRYAKAFSNRFAFKANFSYLKAKDWYATDYRDQSGVSASENNRVNNPAYNGINLYGDEISAALPIGPNGTNVTVSRTGYEEKDLVNYNTQSIKFSGALHYRLNDQLELIGQMNYGTGTSVYTGNDRYSLVNFRMSQSKIELKGDNFFVRGYTTQERSGDAYASGIMGQLINESWSPSVVRNAGGQVVGGWFAEYGVAYAGAVPNIPAGNHTAARAFADRNRILPGSPAFEAAKAKIKDVAIPNGAKFLDRTNMYHAEAMYNFKNQIKFAEVIVGGNFRTYQLNSDGTIFADKEGRKININEFGGYAQIARRFVGDRLKLTASLRYDKNQNFEGQFTPRASAVYTVAQVHNIRVSYQTGFRIPTTQDQYIDLLVPQARLIGGLPEFRNTYNLINNPGYTPKTVTAAGAAFQGAYVPAYTQAYTVAKQEGKSDQEAAAAGTAAGTQAGAAAAGPVFNANRYQFRPFRPEKVQSFEVGYKSLIANKLLIDAYYYYNIYRDFSGNQQLLQTKVEAGGAANPFGTLSGSTRNVFQFPQTSEGQTLTHGWALGLTYSFPKGYTLGGNVSYNRLIKADPSIALVSYNTPPYRTNLNLGNRNMYKGVGFGITWRYQDSFLWESAFGVGTIPSYHTVDAQVSYKIAPIKSIVKLGAANLLNQKYVQSWGNPSVGGLYYVSITFDELLN